MIKLVIFLLATVINNIKAAEVTWSLVGNPLTAAYPCTGSDQISVSFEPGRPPEEENEYGVSVNIEVPKYTRVSMEFDSEATVSLGTTAENARITSIGNIFSLSFFKPARGFGFTVRGPPKGTVPYFKSLKINNHEYCEKPLVGYLDNLIYGHQDTAVVELKAPDGCGKRKVKYTELIVNGEASKAGDWPWHIALYKLDKHTIKYICGGTLISKTMVLSAAHCVTIRGTPVTPEILSVVLGKYNLIGGDLMSQEREVYSIIVHEDFAPTNYLANDIALLKLKNEATYNDFVQPACLWYKDAYDRLPTKTVFGTVVGWGFDQSSALSSQLKQAYMPKISESKCIKKNPLFYAKVLTDKKFCAGWANGTSACNGDSGGGFVVFVPDVANDKSADAEGSWYVRGIVSMSASRPDVALCDPLQYVVFTDVAKYTGWIRKHLEN